MNSETGNINPNIAPSPKIEGFYQPNAPPELTENTQSKTVFLQKKPATRTLIKNDPSTSEIQKTPVAKGKQAIRNKAIKEANSTFNEPSSSSVASTKDKTTIFNNLQAEVIKLRNKLDGMPKDNRGKLLERADNELYNRVLLLEKLFQENPSEIATVIKKFHKEKLFMALGTFDFVSFLLQSNINLKENPKTKKMVETLKITDLERVAIYGYTTEHYKKINSAMREAKGEKVPDSNLNVYIKTAISGMKKIPDLDAPLVLYRAFFHIDKPIKWIKENSTYICHAFNSATQESMKGGDVGATFIFDANKATNVKDLKPFSAWPGEEEIVIMPGSVFSKISANFLEKKVTFSNKDQ